MNKMRLNGVVTRTLVGGLLVLVLVRQAAAATGLAIGVTRDVQTSLRIHEEPDLNSPILGRLRPHRAFVLFDIQAAWVVTPTAAGRLGFAAKDYISVVGDSSVTAPAASGAGPSTSALGSAGSGGDAETERDLGKMSREIESLAAMERNHEAWDEKIFGQIQGVDEAVRRVEGLVVSLKPHAPDLSSSGRRVNSYLALAVAAALILPISCRWLSGPRPEVSADADGKGIAKSDKEREDRSSHYFATMWNWCVELVSFEWVLTEYGLPNGGSVIAGRSLCIAIFFSVLGYAARATLLDHFEIPMRAKESATGMLFLGKVAIGIWGAAYLALYSRFAAQWTYLSNLYNQILVLSSTIGHDATGLARMKAAFIADAVSLHLATKPLFISAVRRWLDEGDDAVWNAFSDFSPDNNASRQDIARRVGSRRLA